MQHHGHPADLSESDVRDPLSGELIDLRERSSDGEEQRRQSVPSRLGRLQKRSRLALYLFLATCASTFLVAGLPYYGKGIWTVITQGLSYAVPVMSILLAHEMGHYLQAKRYGVPASLPFFIPMPLTPLGTMGAVIFQGRGVADRKQMFDIAISGPLAGLVVALPVTYFGMLNATVEPMANHQGTLEFGDPLIIQWMATMIHGAIPEGHTVMLNSMLFAGWVGIFVTALNLIPVGQLDGGHILYTLIGKRAHFVAMAVLWGAVGYMIWSGEFAYSLLIVLILLMGPRHPPTRDDTVPLGTFRIVVGWLTLAFIIIGFTLTPIVNIPE